MGEKNNPFSLKGKTIIITGASSGLGRACAIAASKQGAVVYVFGRNMERLNETIALMTNPELHSVYSVDLTDTECVKKLFNGFKKDRRKFHGLVHCAGISTTLPVKLISEEKLKLFFETNVHSSFFITQQLTKKCFNDDMGCSIVLMSSVMGIVGEMGKALYSATKGAIISAVKSMAVELASRNIRVNCISPGVVKSPMTDSAFYNRDKDAYSKIIDKHPLGIGDPEDIANTSVFLLSGASKWITGTNIVVDGGYTAK